MNEWQLIAVSAALIIGYQYAAIRLSRFAQPLRLELAERGEDLIARGRAPLEIRSIISFVLDQMLSRRAAWLLVIVHPLTRCAQGGNGRYTDALRTLSDEDRKEVSEILRKGMLCILANSPFAALLFLIEVIALNILVPIGRSVTRSLVAAQSVQRWHDRSSDWFHNRNSYEH